MILTFEGLGARGQEERKTLVEQLYYVHGAIEDLSFEGQDLLMDFAGTQGEVDGLRERVIKLAEANAKTFRPMDASVLMEFEGSASYSEDPFPQLCASRQVTEARTPGVFVYGGQFLASMRALDRIVFDLAMRRGAEEVEVPTTMPLASLVKAGYVASFPQHALFAAPVQPDLDAIGTVERAARETQAPAKAIASSLSVPEQVLTPTVCYPCFESLRGVRIPRESLTLTAIAKCHRYEHKTTVGLERLQTFTMREVIFFGPGETVARQIRATMDEIGNLLKTWGLKFRVIAASDPFFAVQAANKRTFQVLYGLKQELQVWLPYGQRWLAAGSFNHHRSTLVQPFEISAGVEGIVNLESGCIGFGFERLLLGMLAQFGGRREEWPKALREVL